MKEFGSDFHFIPLHACTGKAIVDYYPDAVYYAYESDYGLETDASRRAFRSGDAWLVVFDTFEDQMADIYGEKTQERMQKLFENLNIIFDGDDGTIYTMEQKN